jgi:hypothetical protein
MKRLLLALFFSPLLATAASPSNGVIDLTLPSSPQSQTDMGVFDESVLFTPNFAINQNDPALADLFDKNGGSNLCFPTALAESLTALLAYGKSSLSRLKLAGLSADGSHLEANALVRDLATACHTDLHTGTNEKDALQCTLDVFNKSGYGAGGTKMITPFEINPSAPMVNREVTLADLRAALKKKLPVLLEVAWFSFDPVAKVWTRNSGHYFSVFGFNYNRAWGEDHIQLKVVNPETNYGTSRVYSLWDTITLERISPQPGLQYPAHRNFTAWGAGFGGIKNRGFVGLMIALDPAGSKP